MTQMAWLCLLAGCASAYAQPPTDAKYCRLQGRVVNKLSSEQVRKADVTLERVSGARPGAAVYRAVSEAGGTFLFDSIEPGSYRLRARRQGFVATEYGAKRSGSGTPITCTAGQVLRDLNVELTPQAVISGRVVDDDGDPVPRASVRVVRVSGSRLAAWTGATFTNDIGEFRLGELNAAVYKLVADYRQELVRSKRADNKPDETLIRTFFPSVQEPDAATPIPLAPGQTITGVEIRLRRSPVFRVRGKLARNDSTEPLNRLNVLLAQEGVDSRMMGSPPAFVRPDGTFEITGVPPGRHVLTVFGQRGTTLVRQSVAVGARDVDDVAILVPSPVTLNGAIRFEKENTTSSSGGMRGPWVELTGPEESRAGAVMRPDHSFTVLLAGTDVYRINVSGLAPTAYLKSARLGNRDVLDTGIDLSTLAGASDLQLVIGTTNAAVYGTVTDDRQQPAGGITVALLRTTASSFDTRRVLTATTDQNGAFHIAGAAPGTHVAIATEDWDTAILRDEEALKKLAEKGKRLDLKEDGQETVQLRIAPEP